MTEIKYIEYNNKFQIVANGHAGYAPSGSDIVCASVSILLQTLAARLDEVAERRNVTISDGHIEIIAEGGMESFHTILAGLEMIAEEFPQYVSLKGCPIFPTSEMK